MPLSPDRIKAGLCTSEELVFDVLERLGPSDIVEIVSALPISPRTVAAALRTLHEDGAITVASRSNSNPDTVYRVADRQRGTPVSRPNRIEHEIERP